MKKTVLVTGACINTGVAIVEKFASENWNVVFTGRDPEKVAIAEKGYQEKYPNVTIEGYAIDSLLDEQTVDEKALDELFADLDKKNVLIDCLVLNAADQGLNMKIFENPLTDFMPRTPMWCKECQTWQPLWSSRVLRPHFPLCSRRDRNRPARHEDRIALPFGLPR